MHAVDPRTSGLTEVQACTLPQTMDAHTGSDDVPDLLAKIDDACLHAVLAQLPIPKDLLVASAACKRLHSAARANSLWIKHFYSEFGLCITTQYSAATGASAHVREGALQLYKQLMQGQLQQRALPLEAVCTDGGCDEPYNAYWAGNLFVPKRNIMYCSESSTRNVHVFARLCPETATPQQQQPSNRADNGNAGQLASEAAVHDVDDHHHHHQQQQHGGPHAAGNAVPADPERRRREFLLDRCPFSGKFLIAPELVAQQKLQQRQLHARRNVGVIQRFCRYIGEYHSLDDKLAAATNVLRKCSTEGLADFFLAAYMEQHLSSDWALALFTNLNDEQIQHVHEVAFGLWAELSNPKQQKFVQLPLPPLPAATSSSTMSATATAAAAYLQHATALATSANSSSRAGSSTAATRHDQRAAAAAPAGAEQQPAARQLLCDEHQLCALSATTKPGQNLCVVREIILGRDDAIGQNPSTCPVGSGMVFLGHYQHTATTLAAAAAHGCSSSGRLPPPGLDAQAALTAAAAAQPAAKAAAAALAAITHQPWVAAANDLTTAAAVITAAHAGLLPPILDYVKAGTSEYIEFAQPSQQQLQRQQQEWAHMAGSSAVQAGSSNGGAGCWPAPGFLVPVLWFRFPPAPVQQDEDDGNLFEDLLGEILGQEPQGQQAEHTDSDSELEASDAGSHHMEAPEAVPRTGHVVNSELQGDAEPLPSSETMAAATVGWQATPDVASTSSAAAAGGHTAPAAVQLQHVAAAAVTLQPRAVPAADICPKASMLPAAATEAAAALGWFPSHERHPSMMYIPLRRPRTANLVCVKLLDCEDVKPEFNRSRGGCNIDMQLVMLRGSELGQLPAGLELPAVGLWPC